VQPSLLVGSLILEPGKLQVMSPFNFYARVLLAMLLAGTYTTSQSQIVIDNTQTPDDLVQNTLLGAGVIVSNITFNGAPGNTANDQIGHFNSANSNVGLSQGIMLASGDVHVADSPNSSPGLTLGGPGTSGTDPDLIAISSAGINDEAILEFDFVPTGNTVTFRYVFGSEEYNEYVCSNFNDVFGFFISGPGIAGPYTNGAENLAIIPNSTDPVAINWVNNGTVGSAGAVDGCGGVGDPGLANSAYFVDNENNTSPMSVEFDGLTTVLVATSSVQCGQTYHIKMAIADAGDGALDSGVFLEGGSFGSSGVTVTAATITGDSIMVEDCGAAIFTFFRPDTSADFTIQFDINGTATSGVDYTAIPDSIVVPQGQFSDSLVVDALFDGISEGTETITITIVYDNGCTGNDTISATIYIQNVDPLVAQASGDTIVCTPEELAVLSSSISGGVPPYGILWTNSAGVTSSVIVGPLVSTTYSYTVIDSCGNTATSNDVFVNVQCEPVPPNVFTPNGDGENELFVVLNLDQYPGSRLLVYNRWGRVVYDDDNYQNDWDGGDLSEGVYYFIVYPNSEDEIEPIAGHVSIFR
jgi:gliding motility-associated-like protein